MAPMGRIIRLVANRDPPSTSLTEIRKHSMRGRHLHITREPLLHQRLDAQVPALQVGAIVIVRGQSTRHRGALAFFKLVIEVMCGVPHKLSLCHIYVIELLCEPPAAKIKIQPPAPPTCKLRIEKPGLGLGQLVGAWAWGTRHGKEPWEAEDR